MEHTILIFQVNLKRTYFKSDTGSTSTSTYIGSFTSVFRNIKILQNKHLLDFDFQNMAKGFICIQVLNYSQRVQSRKRAMCQ